MTEHKHLKALIRARMARTGESYTAARSHLVQRQAPPALAPVAEFRAHDKHCMTAVFTPDDAHLITGGFGGQARIWTVDGTLAGELIGHTASVNVVRISPDGSTVITAASDRTVRVWDLPTRRQIALLGRHRKKVLALDFDARRNRAWSGGHDGTLRLWHVPSAQAEAEVQLGGSVTAVSLRPTDGSLAAATRGAGIAILNPDGAEIARLAPDTGVFGVVTWAADGSFLVASSPEAVTVWAAENWEPVRFLASGTGSIVPVALSPDGGRIAVGWDHTVGVWSADESVPAVTVDGLPKGVYGLAFSHDGRSLAAAAADGRVRVWAVT